METAGKIVIFVVELTARMQSRQDQLDPGDFVLRVNIHGHAAPVVYHFNRSVCVDTHFNLTRVTGDGLVHTVVDHLLHQVIGSGGIGVHTRPAAHRLET